MNTTKQCNHTAPIHTTQPLLVRPGSRTALLLGALLASAVFGAKARADAISREITIHNDLSTMLLGSDAVCREFTVFNTPPDCNENSLTDECDIDCQAGGGICNVTGCGESMDCNANVVPDECDLTTSEDCNGNAVPDECEPDCQPNGVADECDIDEATSADCNANTTPDECDLADMTSQDCNSNAVPDECDIASTTSQDCNGNSTPDECDLAGGTSQDCNDNAIPDECETDCQPNGIADECDIADLTSDDCNANLVPDECDIAAATSTDCNENSIPDECDLASTTSQDCNDNATPDECDIASGASNDCEGNGIPDECEACQNARDCGDVDCDGRRDDACLWYDCVGGNCVTAMKTTQADIGDLSGACPPDTSCDGGDRFHALNCFSDKDTTGLPPYPCESSPPSALNVDAGSQSSCALDGVCDGIDAFHALNCFANRWFDGSIGYQCGCSGPGPSTTAETLPRLQRAGLALRAPAVARPGDLVAVDVHLDGGLKALRGYQLHLGASGGTRGTLELVDISVNAQRPDYVFADVPGTWSAFNRDVAQMVAGVDAPEGVPARDAAYLATFTYRVPKDTRGIFVIELRYGGGSSGGSSLNPHDRTFLFGRYASPIEVASVTLARIEVLEHRARSRRHTKPVSRGHSESGAATGDTTRAGVIILDARPPEAELTTLVAHAVELGIRPARE